jgi:hypothetical protein
MKIETAMDKSGAYIVSQRWDRYEAAVAAHPRLLKPSLTISHQTGAGA